MGEVSRVSIVDATNRDWSAKSLNTRRFGLDHLSALDPSLLRNPGINPMPGIINLLREREQQ